MGANQTKSVIETVTNMLNEQVTKVLSSTENTSLKTITLTQSIGLTIGPTGSINCGSGEFNISEGLHGDIQTTGHIDNKQSEEITSILKSVVDEAITNKVDSQAGFLSNIFTFNNTEAETKAITNIKNSIEQNITNTVINKVIDQYQFSQGITVVVNGSLTASGCKLTQDASLSIISSSIIGNAIEIIASSEAITSLELKSETTAKSKLTGLQIFGISGGAILLIAAIVLVIYFVNKNKKKKEAEALARSQQSQMQSMSMGRQNVPMGIPLEYPNVSSGSGLSSAISSLVTPQNVARVAVPMMTGMPSPF